MMRRREFLFPTKKSSADCELFNKLVTGEHETLPIQLMNQNQAFSILMKFSVLTGYDLNTYSCILDFLTCNTSPGTVNRGVEIRHYGTYVFNRFINTGTYYTKNNIQQLNNIACMVYNPELQTNNLSVLLSSNSVVHRTRSSFTPNDSYMQIGGVNGWDRSEHATTGNIEELYIYKRALTDTDLLNYYTDNIIP